MAVISANALFHFTSFEYLKDILENKFHPNYCAEDYISLMPIGDDTYYKKLGPKLLTPMLCFCDLPLSNISTHITKYGSYGIGLKKEWGINNNLNPVFYVQKESRVNYLNDSLFTILKGLSNEKKEEFKLNPLVYNSWDGFDRDIEYYLSFIKPIKGRRLKKDLTFEEEPSDFYDEKEWRYVPNLINAQDNGFGIIDNTEELPIESLLSIKNTQKKILEKHIVNFKPDDIKHLIVRSNSEIYDFTEFIDSVYKSASKDEIAILKTKIISIETIKEDF